MSDKMWDNDFCKICFEHCNVSRFNCGHFIHLNCQIKSGMQRCPECMQPIRLTRWLDQVIAKARAVLTMCNHSS